jgi:hypothetical protein
MKLAFYIACNAVALIAVGAIIYGITIWYCKK